MTLVLPALVGPCKRTRARSEGYTSGGGKRVGCVPAKGQGLGQRGTLVVGGERGSVVYLQKDRGYSRRHRRCQVPHSELYEEMWG